MTTTNPAARLPPGWRAPSRSGPDPFSERLFIVQGGQFPGTLGVRDGLTAPWLYLHSRYVHREHRRRGLATRVLDTAYAAARAAGYFGLLLSTGWNAYHPAWLYVRTGLWVYHWKRDLTFVRDEQVPDLQVSERDASIGVKGGAARIRVQRELGRLLWSKQGEFDDVVTEVRAWATLSLVAALLGWPITASDDVGGPANLAWKIEIFEAVARMNGQQCQPPRIPGIAYRDLSVLHEAPE